MRLTQCPRCKKFADKYVEHDFVVLFIDLVLIKPQVCNCTVIATHLGLHGGDHVLMVLAGIQASSLQPPR